MHLQGAIAATEGDTPLAVTKQLYLVVAGLLYVQFDQNVLVVTDTVRLDLKQNFANQLRCRSCCLLDVGIGRVLFGQQQTTENSLALTTAAADNLETDSGAGIALEHSHTLFFNLNTEFVYGKEIDTFHVRGLQDMIRQCLKSDILVSENLLVAFELFCLDDCQQSLTTRMLGNQSKSRDIVDSRGD